MLQVKIAPETAMKLTFNDAIKHVVCADPEQITAGERMVGGAIAGASAQVRAAWASLLAAMRSSALGAATAMPAVYAAAEVAAALRMQCRSPRACLAAASELLLRQASAAVLPSAVD